MRSTAKQTTHSRDLSITKGIKLLNIKIFVQDKFQDIAQVICKSMVLI